MSDTMTVAVPRGAMFSETLDLLEGLGRDVSAVRSNDRKLFFPEAGLITMRPSDVLTYVSSGVADLGITGKDVLMEHNGGGVYELFDLGYAACRMVVAAREQDREEVESRMRELGTLRVATKYPNVAKRYFAESGRQVEIVEVKGSVELAPVTGLADAIVDLTQSGATLSENGLVVLEDMSSSTARLVANRVSYNYRSDEIDEFLGEIRQHLNF